MRRCKRHLSSHQPDAKAGNFDLPLRREKEVRAVFEWAIGDIGKQKLVQHKL